MKTIELEIDEALLDEIDRATRSLDVSRETFIRAALRRALREQAAPVLEEQHARGYALLPQQPEEVDEWESERVWSEP